MRLALRSMSLHGLRIGRIHAHVTSALPFALQRINDFQCHFADLLDFDLDHLPILNGAKPFVIGTRRR